MEDRERHTIFTKPSIWKTFMLEAAKIHGNDHGSKSMEIELALHNHIINMRYRGIPGKSTHIHDGTKRDEILNLRGRLIEHKIIPSTEMIVSPVFSLQRMNFWMLLS